jgi:hypothetical protein
MMLDTSFIIGMLRLTLRDIAAVVAGTGSRASEQEKT